MGEFVCNSKDCKKRENCNMPTGEGVHDIDSMNCSCKTCDWSESEKPCEFIGDPYNTDGECLAFK